MLDIVVTDERDTLDDLLFTQSPSGGIAIRTGVNGAVGHIHVSLSDARRLTAALIDAGYGPEPRS